MAERPPAEVTQWRGYLRALERFGTPDEIDEILRELGTPKRVKDRNAEIAAIIENRRRIRWIVGSIREAGVWIVGVGAAIAMLYGAYSFVALSWRQPQPPAVQQPEERP